MLISKEKKFLFVHIQKTAGTSLATFLKREIPDLENYFRQHDHIKMAEDDLGSMYETYYKAAFVRNPFDRLVSWYSMIVSKGKLLSDQEKEMFPDYNQIWQYVLANSNTFSEFILNCHDATNRAGWKPFLTNQIDYITNNQGDISMDCIGRFESIEAGLQKICEYLEVSSKVVPHLNVSRHVGYRDYYTDETKAIVAKRFYRDIEAFEYSF